MITNHLSEHELQQYALNKPDCDKNIIAHAESCKDCQANVQAYLQLFSVIREQPKPAFDFNLQKLVLQKIPQAKSKFSLNIFFVYFFALVAVSAISITVYLFRNYIFSMFSGVLPMAMYLIAITALLILVFQGIEMYMKYRKQISALN